MHFCFYTTAWFDTHANEVLWSWYWSVQCVWTEMIVICLVFKSAETRSRNRLSPLSVWPPGQVLLTDWPLHLCVKESWQRAASRSSLWRKVHAIKIPKITFHYLYHAVRALNFDLFFSYPEKISSLALIDLTVVNGFVTA